MLTLALLRERLGIDAHQPLVPPATSSCDIRGEPCTIRPKDGQGTGIMSV
jgi:hypothetical protein